MVKNPSANTGYAKVMRLIPGPGKIPWSRIWQPTPVFLPGESRGERSLAGYSPRGHKEVYMTEQLHTHTHTQLQNLAG